LKRRQTHHSPFKKQDRSWARSGEKRQKLFAVHLSKIFKPNSQEITLKEKNRLFFNDTTSTILDIPTRSFIINEVKAVIKYVNPKKVPNYDLITNQILQRLPKMEIKYII